VYFGPLYARELDLVREGEKASYGEDARDARRTPWLIPKYARPILAPSYLRRRHTLCLALFGDETSTVGR
jgi:hypothetical protein